MKKMIMFLFIITLLVPSLANAEFYLGSAKIGTGPTAVLTNAELAGFNVCNWNAGRSFYSARQIARQGYKTIVVFNVHSPRTQSAHLGNDRWWPIDIRGPVRTTPFRILLIGSADYVFQDPITSWYLDPNAAIIVHVKSDMSIGEFFKAANVNLDKN